MNFIIYHSGYEAGTEEGPFDPARAERGVDTLIKSVLDNDIGPNGNVYAELGSTWRFVMRDPTTAAHLLGKLLTHIGEDNVLWGTDSIWYGSPQDQIQAFRSFQIAPPLVEAHGYPQLTPELKAKVFGLNGARVYGVEVPEQKKKTEVDPIGRKKAAYREQADADLRDLRPQDRSRVRGAARRARRPAGLSGAVAAWPASPRRRDARPRARPARGAGAADRRPRLPLRPVVARHRLRAPALRRLRRHRRGRGVSAVGLVLARLARPPARHVPGARRAGDRADRRWACPGATRAARARRRRSTTSRPTSRTRRRSRRSCRCAPTRRTRPTTAAPRSPRSSARAIPTSRPLDRRPGAAAGLSLRRSPRRSSMGWQIVAADRGGRPHRGDRPHLLVRLHRRRRRPDPPRGRRQPDRRPLGLAGRRRRHRHQRGARPRLSRGGARAARTGGLRVQPVPSQDPAATRGRRPAARASDVSAGSPTAGAGPRCS